MADGNDIDLQFEGVSKRYKVRHESAAGKGVIEKLKNLIGSSEQFWALRDVSFAVKRGEALGIIGHNGAGKSTILKLLSNITAPTTGVIRIHGRLSALIEVGSGFHPELSGRENIYLSGSILGMRRQEIREKLDSIIDFAEVRQFIDTPVKRYSSGMYVRLGFSIAAHLDPHILLLDEVLAVGDAAFQEKCLDRIRDLKEAGTTIVFISHDLAAVQKLCDRVLLMQRGELVAQGPASEVIATYQGKGRFVASGAVRGVRTSERAAVKALHFYGPTNDETGTFATGEPMRIAIEYTADENLTGVNVQIYFVGLDETLHCTMTTDDDGVLVSMPKGTGIVEFSCPAMVLHPGVYYLDVVMEQPGDALPLASHFHCSTIQVVAGRVKPGNFHIPHEWRVIAQSETVEALHGARAGGPAIE